MKLYTEEEIRKRLNSPMDYEVTIDEFIESLTPIELPSDEEIKTYLNNHSYEFEHGFKDAIEFIKNKYKEVTNEKI